jgi:hypothetical protein
MSEPEKKITISAAAQERFRSTADNMHGKAGKFAREIWACFKESRYRYYDYYMSLPQQRPFAKLQDAYAELCGVRAEDADTFDAFWNRKFAHAIQKLFGRENEILLRQICALAFEAPYAHSLYRPSYRSLRAGDYAASFFRELLYEIDFRCYELSLVDAMRQNKVTFDAVESRIALALRRGDGSIAELTKEAIFGENDEVRLSQTIVRGIIKSGIPEQLDALGKLLLAAKGQEGIRQVILENADCGAVQTHAYFIKLMIDGNLTRFSSVIRAFDTWTGLAYGNAKPAIVDKCVRLAYDHLSDAAKFRDGVNSADPLEIYMALWAQACRDIFAAKSDAERLTDAPEKHRRLTGWYFLCSTLHKAFTHEIAVAHIETRDPEELAWVCRCLYDIGAITYMRYGEPIETAVAIPDSAFPKQERNRKAQFDKLCAAAEFIGNKSTQFDGSVLPWMWVQLQSLETMRCLFGLAAYDRDPAMIEKLADYLPIMAVDNRRIFYVNLLDPDVAAQRQLLLEGLADKSATIKNSIVERLGKPAFQPTDIAYLADVLTTTGAVLRKTVMSLLSGQPEELIRPAIDTMLYAQNAKQLLAGVELLDIFAKQNPALLDLYNERVSELRANPNLPNDIAVILKRLGPSEQTNDFTIENGFGLYSLAAPDFDRNLYRSKRPNTAIHSRKELNKLLVADEKELRSIIAAVNDILTKNRGLECETSRYDGSKTKVLIGDDPYRLPLLPEMDPRGDHGIEDYHLGNEIMTALKRIDASPLTIAKSLCIGSWAYNDYPQFTPAAKRIFNGLPFEQCMNLRRSLNLFGMVYNTLNAVLRSKHDGVFDLSLSLWRSLVSLVPESEIMTAYREPDNVISYPPRKTFDCMYQIRFIAQWRDTACHFIETDEQFAMFWNELWYEYLLTDRQYLPRYDYFQLLRAHKQKLIGDDGLFHELLIGSTGTEHIRIFTGTASWVSSAQKQAKEQYPFFEAYLEKAIDRIVTVEENRGEVPTPLSPVAAKIEHFKGGTQHFMALLTALGKDNFHRGYTWYNREEAKKILLSSLLKACYPKADDTADGFKAAAASAGIGEKRLLQAVMYAPQWADLAEKATGIAGLASAVWLFHAHISEKFSAEKETRVALYSPIGQQEFADGVFDKDWFWDAYNTVGSKIFGELYKNAKYITSSNSAHRRSQLYADAILERLDRAAIEAEIADKRNAEKLRAYALIPIDRANPGDALARYEFIQKFAKESKQFGAQRRASEGKAVHIALQNLALTTGFGDADRMTWYLESEKMDVLRPLMEPYKINDTEVRLSIAEDGTPSIGVCKDGKELKSLPKALAKNEKVAEIQTAIKDLREQKRRARAGFEMAMTARTVFAAEEILKLLSHPVLQSAVSALVFVSGDTIGFPVRKEDRLYLTAPDETEHPLAEQDSLLIAHPYDLIQNKCWSAYQQYLYKHQITQPFKQVFREYYPVTEDETAEVNISRRYAGHQVQPQKTIALLKSRGWTVDYEEGLQRVYYKENMIARMYAAADWFSPADIEAPTLEVVRFFSRDGDEPVDFDAVPPVIFSEVMRDIDLVVSVAHVGGVDPEASHSTVEMRIAIARELLALLAVNNVSFQSAHAAIKGSMGDYSVHMGSGVVHQSGVGMLAVLPVHSQARGRIFLPFADDDPKTAEIMSKILLFADDKKIKDPAILRQIGEPDA